MELTILGNHGLKANNYQNAKFVESNKFTGKNDKQKNIKRSEQPSAYELILLNSMLSRSKLKMRCKSK